MIFFFNKKLVLTTLIPSTGSIGIFGRKSNIEEYRIIVNYNGQADLLLSLQIPPDYYPYQFKKTNLYDYLTNIGKYIVSNHKTSSNKQKIKNLLQSRIDTLLSKVKEFGPSLWNEDLYDTGIVFRNNQFWSSKKTSLLFIEQFIADDYVNIQDSYNLLPVHKQLIITNYRAARDPYTIFSKKIFDCFKNSSNCTGTTNEDYLFQKFKSYMDNYKLEDANSLYRFGKFISFWNDLIETNKDQLDSLKFNDWLNDKNLFSVNSQEDQAISQKYAEVIFTKEELCLLNEWWNNKDGATCNTNTNQWTINYKKTSSITKVHHPALEQQILPGTAPLAEGSQKDIIVFLYQFAALIDRYVKDTKSFFNQDFKDDYRKKHMEHALKNASLIAQNVNTRISKIRDYFKELGVVDSAFTPENKVNTNSKTFTVLTYPPSSFGAGEATIQSMSKFPFIYQDIGLKQPVPSNLYETHQHDPGDLSREIFSVDDNGWWWKIGSANLDPTNLLAFKGTSDTLMILANEDDWNLLQDENSRILTAASTLLKNNTNIDINKVQGNEKSLKNNKGYPVSYNRYHLWNEGLRSPIAINLLLDNLVDIFQRQYDPDFSKTNNYQESMDWGEYWHSYFLENSDSEK